MTGILPIGALSINDTRQNEFTWSDTASHVAGRHALKMGASFSRFRYNNRSQGALAGDFSFDVLPTDQISDSSSTGNAVASFLLGYPSDTSIATYNPTFGYRWNNFATFVQDDFRVSPKLTLNLGMRYEIETPMTEVHNLMSNFDLQTGSFIFAGVDGEPRALARTDYHNLGPRFGFAWTPRHNGQLVVRGGYGIFYASTSSSQVQSSRSTGFTETATFNTPDNRITLPIKLDVGIPPITISPITAIKTPNISTNVIEPNSRRAQTQQWNFNLQRQFGNFVVEGAYAGDKGTHLVAASYNVNQVPTNLLGPGNLQDDRPYPPFQNITVNNPNAATSIYNSGYISVNRRLSTGLTLITSFTVQKSIDSSSGRGGASLQYGAIAPQNNYDRAAEQAISQFDRTKRFIGGAVYDLPLGHAARGLRRTFLAGWESSGILEMMDGYPLAFSNTPNITNSLGGGSRPNRVPGVSPFLSNPTPQEYFNTAAFKAPPAYTFGNDSRTEPQLRAPGWVTLDFSVLKNFPLGETRSLQFRAESYNLPNHVNFEAPNTTLGTAQFGEILSAWEPRRIQFGLKLVF